MASKNCQRYVQQFQSRNKRKELFWPDWRSSPTSFVSWLFNHKLQQGVDNGVPKQQTANAMFSKSMGKTFFEQAVLTSLGLAVQPQYSTKGIMASDNSRLIMPPCSATLVWWRPFLTSFGQNSQSGQTPHNHNGLEVRSFHDFDKSNPTTNQSVS